MASTPTVYLLHGDDEFGLAEFVREQLILRLGDPTAAELNLTRFEGKSVNLSELRGACAAMPFLAARRLVLVTDYLRPLTEHAGGKREAEALVEFFPQLPPTTALVFVEHRNLPRSSPVFKWAQSAGEAAFVRQFDLPRGGALISWILKRAKAAGGEFTPPAAQALAIAVGEHPRLVDAEILKLLTYVNFERPVAPADVERLTPYAAEANIFEMVDALGRGEGQIALRELHRLLEDRDRVEGYFMVFGMIVRQFRLLLQTRELLESGARAGDVARELGLHPYPAGKLAQQARNFTLPALEGIYRRLLAVDEGYKTGKIEGITALDTLVAELAG
ncbi:MAG: DNA polymerase III subunit delta [Chloroflexi bacterium]|nr:DNA polymerase III subunit delta [Chloroflexota bacterium]